MVFQQDEDNERVVYGTKLSSVGPGRVTGTDVVHEPTVMDLAMKLHYLRGVYFMGKEAVEGVTVKRLKEPMFTWFNDYYTTCGRFKRSDPDGRPFIKCNDCGVRFVEAKCDKTVEEWLEMDADGSLRRLLVPHQVIGPELSFSPTFLIQVTQFKCGGMSLGLSWAHVLGDPFSASDCFNKWGRVMSGLKPNGPKVPHKPQKPTPLANPTKLPREPASIKRVGPLGDHWIVHNNCNMEAFRFHLSPHQLAHLESKLGGHGQRRATPFETICAMLWQLIARVRGEGNEPRVVTLFKNDSTKRVDGILSNSQRVSVVEADFSVAGADSWDIVNVLSDQAKDETDQIEEAMERENGVADFVVYGANLSFVDMEEASLYGLELNGHKPILVDYMIEEVGDEGAVIVLPGPPPKGGNGGGGGRAVTVILPENALQQVKNELERGGYI